MSQWTCSPLEGVFHGQRVRRGGTRRPAAEEEAPGAGAPPRPLTSFFHFTPAGCSFRYRANPPCAETPPGGRGEEARRREPPAGSSPSAPSRHLLPWQRFAPSQPEHFYGNYHQRQRVKLWLASHGKADGRRPVAEAMLLLYGDVGTGKSCAAEWALRAAGYRVHRFDAAGDDLVRFLRRVLRTDLAGRRAAVLLDEVDELFADRPEAAAVRVQCPVIATANAPPSRLKRRCESVRFGKLEAAQARRMLARLRPDLRDPAASRILEAARGDYRQLCVQAAVATEAAKGADAFSAPFDAAREALTKRAPLAAETCDFACNIIRWNFWNCCRDAEELEAYAAFQAFCCEVEDAWSPLASGSAAVGECLLVPAAAAQRAPYSLREVRLEEPPRKLNAPAASRDAPEEGETRVERLQRALWPGRRALAL